MLAYARPRDVQGYGRKEVLLAVNNTVEARDALSGALVRTYTFVTNVTALETIRFESLKLAARVVGNGPALRFPTINGKQYRVESTDDLSAGTWSRVVRDNIIGDGDLAQVTDPDCRNHPKCFYRVVRYASP
jgi:hypothetical protein